MRGLKTTFGRLIEGPVTIQYPEEKTPVYPRFRGRHKLHRFADTGLEKCVGCSLCAAACPADCIRVVELGDETLQLIFKAGIGGSRVGFSDNLSELLSPFRSAPAVSARF